MRVPVPPPPGACRSHQEGLWGPDCNLLCPGATLIGDAYDNICNGHGNCNGGREGAGTCVCEYGWTGPACEWVCPGGVAKPCNLRGFCTSLEGCVCTDGWAGPACDVECAGGVDNPCSGHGKCLSGAGGEAAGTCTCDLGWAGRTCDVVCPGGLATPCLGHGVCGLRPQALVRPAAGAADGGDADDVICTCYGMPETGFWRGDLCQDCRPPYHGPGCTEVCTNGVVTGQLCNCTFGYLGFGCRQRCPAFDGTAGVRPRGGGGSGVERWDGGPCGGRCTGVCVVL